MQRTWRIDAEDSLEEEMLRAAAIVETLGGAIVVAAHREEIAKGQFIPVGYIFQYDSYVPGERKEQAPETTEPEPVGVT